MQHTAPAIPRLGVPSYDWWSEALHGIARSGYATVLEAWYEGEEGGTAIAETLAGKNNPGAKSPKPVNTRSWREVTVFSWVAANLRKARLA